MDNALMTMCTAPDSGPVSMSWGRKVADLIAKTSYLQADAMMRARSGLMKEKT